MKVLAICGSPRMKGNCDVLCDQFLKGAQRSNHEVEKIRLSDYHIQPCLACYGCKKTKKCVVKDDMDIILTKMIDADVIVLATPVYFYSMSAQMKMMIDRCLPRYMEIKNKQFYFIVTAADPINDAAKTTIEGLRGFLRCLPNAIEKDIIYGMGAWDKGDIFTLPAIDKAYELGCKVK